MEINAILTQNVVRPNTIIERQCNFQEWLLKIQSKYYAQHRRVVNACEGII